MVMGKLLTAFVIGNTSSLIALSPSHLGSFYSPQLLTHSIFIEPTLPVQPAAKITVSLPTATCAPSRYSTKMESAPTKAPFLASTTL